MHANKLELVSSQTVGPTAHCRQREKSPHGGYDGWLRSHEVNDSAYESSVSADCLRIYTLCRAFSFPLLATVGMVSSTTLVLTATIGHRRLTTRTTPTN